MIAGGDINDTRTKTVYIFDSNDGSFTSKANLIWATRETQLTMLDPNTIIQTGGNGQGYIQGHCSKYDIYQNKWVELPALNIPRGAHISFTFESKFVYVAYGWNAKDLANYEKFTIGDENW